MLEQLNRAMEHIESHLDERIETGELARIAMTSEYLPQALGSARPGGTPIGGCSPRWRGSRCRSTSAAGG